MRARRGCAGGFTLIEVIVVIAVISILASMAVPYLVKIVDQAREESTRKQLVELSEAIVGDPKVPTAGYLGDMGALPAALSLLNTPQTGLGYGVLGVKHGWNGPYVRIGFSQNAYLVDGWGKNLVYSAATGQIRSLGPDQTSGTGDDIVYPSYAIVPTGRLLVNLYVWKTDNTASQFVQNPLSGVTAIDVRMYYSANGAEYYRSYTAPTGAPLPFSPTEPAPGVLLSTHAGFHAVTATCTIPPNPPVAGQAVVYIPPNNQQTVLNLYLR